MTTRYEMVGNCHISEANYDDRGAVVRRSIVPVFFSDGKWRDADISGESDEVKALAAEHWTPEAVAAYKLTNASAEPTGYRLYKSTLIRRLTEAEAKMLTALLDASPVKSKMLWNASEWIGSDDPLFETLEAAIGGALGAERAAEILAPMS